MRYLSRFTPLLLLLVGFGGSVHAVQLTVMTSYPQPVVSRFEAAFESSNPDIRLQILWRRPDDALPLLLEGRERIDVYWTPSIRNFLALKRAGLLVPPGLDTAGLPQHMGDAPLSDPEGYFLATETAGYGLFVDTERLARLGVPLPIVWRDLTDPRLQGEVALPVPSGVGYAHMLIDQLLQAQGWEQGWNLWREIAANSRLIGARGNFVTEEVSSGRAAVGLTMDFFAASTLATSKESGSGDKRFIYPQQTAFNPAHVAILARTAQQEAARRFVEFLLSERGQTLLFDPTLRKLPVRPSVYVEAPEGVNNPFELDLELNYDPERGLARRALNELLFDAAITHHHEALSRAWSLLRELGEGRDEAERSELAEIRALLSALPLEEPVSGSGLALSCQRQWQNGASDAQCTAAVEQWESFFAGHYEQALDRLRQLKVDRG